MALFACKQRSFTPMVPMRKMIRLSVFVFCTNLANVCPKNAVMAPPWCFLDSQTGRRVECHDECLKDDAGVNHGLRCCSFKSCEGGCELLFD
jgi:hypothetical protein